MAAAGMGDLVSYKNLVHAVAGAAGSSVAITSFYPLDVARTKLQVEDHREAKYSVFVLGDIMNEEGLQGLYRGWFPVVTSVWCSNFVYFYTFNGLKTLAYKGGAKPYPAKDLLLGFIAGVVNVVLTTPLWVANTRLKLQGTKKKTDKREDGHSKVNKASNPSTTTYRGLLDAMYKIARDEGVRGLWSGTLPSIVLAINPAIQFMVYEAVKRRLQKYADAKELSGFVYFLMGAVAKMISTIITYPLQIIQSKLRAGHFHQGMIHWLKTTIKNQGWLALYKGLETKLTQTVAMAALMFLTYEKITAFVFRMMRQQFTAKAKVG